MLDNCFGGLLVQPGSPATLARTLYVGLASTGHPQNITTLCRCFWGRMYPRQWPDRQNQVCV